jgi:hypothetical protein
LKIWSMVYHEVPRMVLNTSIPPNCPDLSSLRAHGVRA